jgi:hypothetical protein
LALLDLDRFRRVNEEDRRRATAIRARCGRRRA